MKSTLKPIAQGLMWSVGPNINNIILDFFIEGNLQTYITILFLNNELSDRQI